MTTQTNEWMTVAEACRYLRITRATLYRWSKRGMVRLHHLGPRTTRVRSADIRRMAGADLDAETWTGLSQDAFSKDWDNPDDAIYDNWREIYGVQ